MCWKMRRIKLNATLGHNSNNVLKSKSVNPASLGDGLIRNHSSRRHQRGHCRIPGINYNHHDKLSCVDSVLDDDLVLKRNKKHTSLRNYYQSSKIIHPTNHIHPMINNNILSLPNHTQTHNPYNNNQYTTRTISTVTELLPQTIPSIWGASGYILKTIHYNNTIPYWACMSITSILVRLSLIPLVIKGAHTSAKFANVAPEVQFLVTNFQNDIKALKEQNAPRTDFLLYTRRAWQTLRGIYKFHDIYPLQVLKSPLLQMPVFWYFSIDIRKIINGADPELAQQLVESSFLWVTDLTEPDAWYGLPIFTGLLMYLNIEYAIGRKSLSGETASKSNVAKVLKDFFQSLSIFMPCFMSHQPAGVQIYLMTSFIFTFLQSAALRTDSFRSIVGLPSMNAPLPQAKLATEFMKLKQLEKEAADARGEDGEILGQHGILLPGFTASFAGNYRSSSIVIDENHIGTINYNLFLKQSNLLKKPSVDIAVNNDNEEMSAIPPTIRSPDIPKVKKESSTAMTFYENNMDQIKSSDIAFTASQTPDERMEAANRGELPKASIQFAPPVKDKKISLLKVDKLLKKSGSSVSSKKKRR